MALLINPNSIDPAIISRLPLLFFEQTDQWSTANKEEVFGVLYKEIDEFQEFIDSNGLFLYNAHNKGIFSVEDRDLLLHFYYEIWIISR